MSPVNTIIVISVVIAAASLLRNFSYPAVDTFLYYHHCSQPKYVGGSFFSSKYLPGSSYESNVYSLLTSLVNSSVLYTYNHFTVSGTLGRTVYGMHHCRGDLTSGSNDCARCVAQAVRILQSLCGGGATGGALLLEGCFVEYENTMFLGVANKTVLARICGTPWGYSSEELTNTNKLVSFVVEVKSGTPSRKASIDQGGQAVAQCTGDLSASNCQDCLMEANKRLKSMCGITAWGEVHLAKCYVRYSSRGATGDAYKKTLPSMPPAQVMDGTSKSFFYRGQQYLVYKYKSYCYSLFMFFLFVSCVICLFYLLLDYING